MNNELAQRFWSKVDASGGVDSCWFWTGGCTGNGYGAIQVGSRMLRAHRLVYEFFIGLIPPGLTIDHLCRNTKCVNPSHLEAVTNKDNVLRGVGVTAENARKERCPEGHHYDLLNTHIDPTGRRHCRACNNEASRQWRRRNPGRHGKKDRP